MNKGIKSKSGRLILISLIISMVAVFIGYGKEEKRTWYEIPVAAHAGGQIDGRTLTNSKEAIEHSIKAGYQLIEVDLNLTSDGQLVLIHGWDDDTKEELEIDNVITEENQVPNFDEFTNLKICRKYTPMTGQNLIDVLKKNKDLYFLLDEKYSSKEDLASEMQQLVTLTEEKNSLLGRVIVQVYDADSYDTIMSVFPFSNVVYATYLHETKDESYWRQVAEECLERNISMVSISRSFISTKKHPEMKYASILKEYNLQICTYTIDKISDAERMINSGVDLLVTNILTEEDLGLINTEIKREDEGLGRNNYSKDI